MRAVRRGGHACTPMQYQLPALALVLRGWRDRDSGTMHLSSCPDFDRLDTARIEDAVWNPDERYASLCQWCYPDAARR